jgi:hypothetical protein
MESSRLKKSLWFRTWRWWWDLIWGFIWRPETRTSIQTERRARKWSLPLVADVTIRTRPHLRLSFEDLSLGPRSRQKGRPDIWSGDPDRWLPTFRSGWDLIQGSNLKTRDEDLSLYRRGGVGGETSFEALIWGPEMRTSIQTENHAGNDLDQWIRMWWSGWDLIWGSHLKTSDEDFNSG